MNASIIESYIIKLSDKTHFRCLCGCNVFHHPKNNEDEYECNACKIIYREEKSQLTSQKGGEKKWEQT